MALNIKNDEAHRLARELAEATGESMTEAVVTALQDRLEAVRRAKRAGGVMTEVARIQRFVASLPDLDTRSPDELLGYDENGLPS
ncbi:MAG: type II toxin-antitoxin system VapB family antitoxin [Trueperaceae bacterium]|nr:type II toxin-antitoxin system VapB family antitoxin [Trueperaceae bacterium]MCC6310675.1 type II toxin-antitoxin system VapB family antitoxin [Trueperaceae bacterium]MCO5172654.1 type II toxin-antitoxin system VapB family antitoxin [Trueperaceae bacterium]MCW5820167.1 type II toxin-antitoxin system VapB family antitoxin [Trueperaceae bacterium]